MWSGSLCNRDIAFQELQVVVLICIEWFLFICKLVVLHLENSIARYCFGMSSSVSIHILIMSAFLVVQIPLLLMVITFPCSSLYLKRFVVLFVSRGDFLLVYTVFFRPGCNPSLEITYPKNGTLVHLKWDLLLFSFRFSQWHICIICLRVQSWYLLSGSYPTI